MSQVKVIGCYRVKGKRIPWLLAARDRARVEEIMIRDSQWAKQIQGSIFTKVATEPPGSWLQEIGLGWRI